MKKAFAWFLVLALAIACVPVALAAEANTTLSGTLTYWSCFSGDSMTWDQWRIGEFEKAYPNIKVDVQFVPESAGMRNGKLMAAIAGGTAPDVVCADDYITAYGFAAQGAFEAWDPYMSTTGMNLDEFMPGFNNLMKYKGSVYLLPQDSNVIFLYMNNAMFKEAGLDPAVDYPKNTAELDALADKLTVKDADGNVTRYGFIPWLDSGDDPLLWSFMFGAQIYDADTNKLLLDDQKIIDAMNWQNTYALKYSAEKIKGFTQSAGGLFSPDHPFFTQKVAMTVVGNWATNALRIYAPQVEYSVCAIPVPEGGRVESTPLGSNVFAIPVGCKNPELAAAFYAFCERPEINGNNFDTWRSIPVIDRLFDQVSWTIKGDPIYLLERKIANSPLSGHPGLCTVSSELRANMLTLRDDVIYNNKNPQPLLQELAAKLQPELDAVK
jgi:multiple sugar transport system substrate-binding protein